MKLFKHWFASGRVRDAKKRLAANTTAQGYAELAQEHALTKDLSQALAVIEEGMSAFPGDPELRRMSSMLRQLGFEDRMRALSREIDTAPRPALWREMCEMMLDAGRLVRAEESAAEWYQHTQDGEAMYYRARARAERFFADRRRDDGRMAYEYADLAEKLLEDDSRPLDLRAEIAARAGAWGEARRDLARLLELRPGDQGIEARFRMAVSMFDGPKSIDQAFREVERSGRLAEEGREKKIQDQVVESDEGDESSATPSRARPLLQQVSRIPGIQAAFYLRGSTALVQGPKGPTAERTARTVREILGVSRSAARRLGLGHAEEIRVEGEQGTLMLLPGELGSAALWIGGEVNRRHEEGLRNISIAANSTGDRN
jgi:predicted regulator of Ras-like GTPase activity (Roadblock/LC7/MglB family)